MNLFIDNLTTFGLTLLLIPTTFSKTKNPYDLPVILQPGFHSVRQVAVRELKKFLGTVIHMSRSKIEEAIKNALYSIPEENF